MSDCFRSSSGDEFGNQSNYFNVSNYLELDDAWFEDDDAGFPSLSGLNQNAGFSAHQVIGSGGSSSHHEGPNARDSEANRLRDEIRERVAFKVKSSTDILEDGFKWRKYGKKMVKSSPNPRNYYRCSVEGCPVKKRVERDRDDSGYVTATYEGIHNHETPRF